MTARVRDGAPSARCPSCGTAIDALRAPVVRVVAGKVVAFCSRACADQPPRAAEAIGPGPIPEAPTPSPAPVAPAPVASLPRAAAPKPPTPAPVEVDDEPPPDEPQTAPELRRRRNRRAAWLIAGIVAGGMAVAVIQTVSPSSPTRVAAEREPRAPVDAPRAVATPAADAAPAVEVDEPAPVAERAVTALRDLLPAPRARVSRVGREAARALSRTGDAIALDVLGRALGDESSDFARLEIGYAMARGGDDRGAKALVAALKSSRRDVRADAARYLALLGDKRAIPVLDGLLGVSQHRLSAAEALAPLRHPRALRILGEFRASGDKEERLRALVALGHAGKADVADELRAVIGDGEFNVGAAEALARLGDAAARPVLVELLASPSLQVDAALGLRRLDPALDPAPHLAKLAAGLASDKDTSRITAAEAIVILTGPPEIAEHD
jgi:HEAT repeat protein